MVLLGLRTPTYNRSLCYPLLPLSPVTERKENNGFANVTDESSVKSLDYAVLASLLPSFSLESVRNVRIVRRRVPGSRHLLIVSGEPTSQSLGPPHSIIVQLSIPTLVRKVLSANKAFTCFRVGDLDKALLEPGMNLPQPGCKIFINEALSSFQFKKLIALKTVAKDIGFKYVSYSSGTFLAQWRTGTTLHVFTSVADLSTIVEAYRAPTGESRLVKDQIPSLTIAPSRTSSVPPTVDAL